MSGATSGTSAAAPSKMAAVCACGPGQNTFRPVSSATVVLYALTLR